ncbi:MAG: response regulator transcription factor [Actinobacteria bacterium]|nr:response regulator transcription factor [Actinomycetota bacterium]
MAGEAFTRLFWDILTDVQEPHPSGVALPEGDSVETARRAVVVEDEEDIRSLLTAVLEQAGFIVHAAADGQTGLELVRLHNPVVTTLDVNMPGMDGFETAKRIRAISATYIVMLSARTEEIDALQGLEAGADDYVAKPFRPRELRARIDAMLRRPRAHVGSAEVVPASAAATTSSGGAAPVAREEESGWLEHKGARLHPEMRIAMLDDAQLDLTRSEFDIFADLLSSGRRVLSKTDLALMLRGERFTGVEFVSDSDARAIEVHMANLRRKLGESPASPRWIETVRGVGYRLTAR